MNSFWCKYAAGRLGLAHCPWRRTAIAETICALLGLGFFSAVQAEVPAVEPSGSTASDEVLIFDNAFLRGLGQNIDLTQFSHAGTVMPGHYTLDIILNGKERMRQQIEVLQLKGEERARVCFKTADIQRWGIKLALLPDQEKVTRLLESDCIEVEELIPGATFTMDVTELSGTLSIPQAYAGRVKRGYVDPAEWDEGITAAILGYHASGFYNQRHGEEATTDANVNINAGFNIAGWRLRHNGSYRDGSDSRGGYSALNSYAETDIDRLQSQLTLGEYFTPGNDFDSVPFTGIQLSSDDSMLPDSERGFAPIIRGIADTNAKITVRQSGSVVYETSVAPGSFVIDDLYATGYAGDLDVTVTEADGREKRFTVPFASVVQMLRPGSSRFNLTAGRYRDSNLHDEPWFMQGAYRYGINNFLTLYGGSILADDYGSALGGAAFATPIGAVALDATFSRAKDLPTEASQLSGDGNMTGQSYRISYSKLLDVSRTNFSLAAYRFSSEEFLSFGDFARLRESTGNGAMRERNRFQVSISQPLGQYGDLNATGLFRNYWMDQPSITTYQLGYSKGFEWGNLGLSLSRDIQDGNSSDSLMLTASIPIGSGRQRPLLSTTATFDEHHNGSIRTNLAGTLGENSQLNYGLYGSRSRSAQESSNSYGANLNYRTSMAQLGTSYSHGSDYQQLSGSASGTLLLHSEGLVMSPERGETMALMVADGAPGAVLNSGLGNRLDGDGEALKAGLVPYSQNTLGINPRGLPMDVELTVTSQETAPRRGAVVRLDYATVNGKPLLLRLMNTEVPFGAAVLNGDDQQVALVGQGGLIYLRGEHQDLRVIWGQQSEHSCKLQYQTLAGETDERVYQQVDAKCTPQ